MKTVRVTAAVLVQDGRIFATQRGYGQYKDGWEFPGGKIEAGETPEETIVREIREELNVTIEVDQYITTVEYDYPEFHLSMDCFYAHVMKGEISLLEHEAARWITIDQLDEIDWLPADLLLIPYLKS